MRCKGKISCLFPWSVDTGDELIALWKKMVKDKKGAELQLNVPGGFKSDLVKKYLIRGVPYRNRG